MQISSLDGYDNITVLIGISTKLRSLSDGGVTGVVPGLKPGCALLLIFSLPFPCPIGSVCLPGRQIPVIYREADA